MPLVTKPSLSWLIGWSEWVAGVLPDWGGGGVEAAFAVLWILLPIWEGNSETYCLQHAQQWLETITDSLLYSFDEQGARNIVQRGIFILGLLNHLPPNSLFLSPPPCTISFAFWAYFWPSLLDVFFWDWMISKWTFWKLIVELRCDLKEFR